MTKRWATALLAVIGLSAGISATSNADMPRFPDIDSYTPVDVQDYIIELPNPGRAPTRAVYFSTPEGIPCAIAPESVGIAGGAGCGAKRLPGLAQAGPYTYIDTANGVRASSSAPNVDGKIQGHELAVLPPFHSLKVDHIICGVDGAGTTACKDAQGRGFILSPAWSGWLPRV